MRPWSELLEHYHGNGKENALVTYVSIYGLVTMVILGTVLPSYDFKMPESFRKRFAIRAAISALNTTMILSAVDLIRQYYTFQKPLREIEEALKRIQSGDFSVRLEEGPEAHFGQLDSIIRGINVMVEELNGIETLRSDFLANVSHELKAPLSVILNYGTLLQQKDLPEEERLQYAKAITRETRKMSSLITNILNLNRLENQQIYPQAVTYDLSEQLVESLLAFEDKWEAKQITIRNEIRDGVFLHADPELLDSVWRNLISNAVKYTEPGGTIAVSLRENPGFVFVTVSDTGCGMSEETVSHIFDKFYQGDPSHAAEGNGLGMALVSRILTIVGGEITVSSEEGKGSLFTVKVPKHLSVKP